MSLWSNFTDFLKGVGGAFSSLPKGLIGTVAQSGAQIGATQMSKTDPIAAAIAGWFGWGKKGAIPGRLKNSYRLYSLLAIAVLTLLLGPVLERIGAAATYADAVLLFASITAQMLMIYQKYEAWPMWLVINIGYTALFYSQEVYLTSGLFLIFTIVAAVGWRQWYGTYRSTR